METDKVELCKEMKLITPNNQDAAVSAIDTAMKDYTIVTPLQDIGHQDFDNKVSKRTVITPGVYDEWNPTTSQY
jgi:hypothetical protein